MYKYSFLLCIGIAVLNGIDGVLTFYGLKHAYIEESNPLMLSIWEWNENVFLLIKLLLSFTIYMIGVKIGANKISFSHFGNVLLNGAFLLYLYIFGIHIFWIVTVV